jgi:hypothetical protein
VNASTAPLDQRTGGGSTIVVSAFG